MKIFEKIYEESKIILTEGAMVERLKSEFNAEIDSHINHAGLIYTNPELLEFLYRQYIDIGHKHNLPIMIMTPTRKMNHVHYLIIIQMSCQYSTGPVGKQRWLGSESGRSTASADG